MCPARLVNSCSMQALPFARGNLDRVRGRCRTFQLAENATTGSVS